MRSLTALVCVALFSGLLAGAAIPASAADDEPLKALVLDHKDPHSKVLGTRAALEAAGFEVDDLPLNRSASSLRADVIVLGSFSSEAPDWWKYSRSKMDGLRRFVAKGGVVVQFAQASSTEATPPFLPKGVTAIRYSGNEQELHVTGAHPLTDGMARHPEHIDQLALARWRGRYASWVGIVWWEGMGVLITAGEDATRAALLEAEHGKGRFVISSLFLDKQPGTKDAEAAKTKPNPQAQFFAGLAAYVRAVQAGTAPPVKPSSPPAEDVPKVGEPVASAWKLALSDVVRYERRSVKKKGGASILGKPEVFTLGGSDLRDGGRYLPADLRRDDLAAYFGLRLTPVGAADEVVDAALALRDVAPVVVEGATHARLVVDPPEGQRQAWVTGAFTFESKGKAGKKDKFRLANGRAATTALVDLDEGVVVHARAEVTYDLVKIDAERGERPKSVTKRIDWRLEGIARARYPGYRGDIAKAIDRGVAWLKGDRKGDKQWKPHGNYDIGTTSLAILTLSACGVARDDPIIAESLDWLFTQTPGKTYDRAVALMAIDEVYTPEGEQLRLREGGKRKQRELPKARQKWVLEVAEKLERTATQPGSWGYPPRGRVIPNLDTSNTQYAILGLNAATHFGYEPKEGSWLGIMRHFQLVREKDAPAGFVALHEAGKAISDEAKTTQGAVPVREVAGFRYSTMKGPHEVWASMTCAGIASLSIARFQLQRIGSKKLNSQVEREIDEAIHGAWAWLDQNWATDRHPHHPGGDWIYYYLYSLERAAILHGISRVGGRDWYFEGAAQLLARQKEKGGWSKSVKRKDAPAVVQTCLALLFLKRATAPLTGR